MRVKNALRHWRFATVPVLLVCAGITAIGYWRATTGHTEQLSDGAKQSVLEAVRRGLGREVYFATSGSSKQQIRAAVESVDSFVHARSNMKMSGETKERLVKMEQEARSGARRGIRAEDLSAALADTLIDRFSKMNDQDINYAARKTQRSDEDYSSPLLFALLYRLRCKAAALRRLAPFTCFLPVPTARYFTLSYTGSAMVTGSNTGWAMAVMCLCRNAAPRIVQGSMFSTLSFRLPLLLHLRRSTYYRLRRVLPLAVGAELTRVTVYRKSSTMTTMGDTLALVA